MNLYNNNDLSLFANNIDKFEKKIKDDRDKKLIPSLETKKAIETIILDFVRDNKRIVYGGFAQNKLVKQKNQNDTFYDDKDFADIDIYSFEPIIDAKKISNILMDKGFQNIEAREALHKETYSIFVEFKNVCDISYVPKIALNKMKTQEINGILYVDASVAIIDLLKMFTDPLISGELRWKKSFPRLYLLQKYYPFEKPYKPLKLDQSIVDDNHKKLLDFTYQYIQNKETFILTGDYPYNCYLEEAKLNDPYFVPVDITFYEIVSTNYRQDARIIYDTIKSTFSDLNITLVEYYPFWTLIGYHSIIMYNDVPIIFIMDYNKRCTPIKKIKVENNFIQIGSFDFNLLMSMMMSFKWFCHNNKEKYMYRKMMASHLVAIRKFYLNKRHKTIIDNTIFESFIVNCVGEPEDPGRAIFFRRKKRKEKKQPIIWSYKPEEHRDESEESTFKFSNTSGNQITNVMNLKVLDRS